MESDKKANIPVVTEFVRTVIGCRCPDEVFRRIEVRRGSTAITSCSADYELRIGGRLLIVITSEPVADLVPRLQRVISEGKRARDEGKFNRFRLVVQSENAAQNREKLLRSFEEVTNRDEKTHLHVVEKSEVSDFFLRTQRTR